MPKKKLSNKISEKDIQKSILEYLEIKNLFHWRNNSGSVFSQYNGKTRMIKLGTTGSPDVFVLIPVGYIDAVGEKIYVAQIHGIEIKTLTGEQSEDQIKWQKDFEKIGGRYHLVRSLDDVMKVM